jgi:hypothetical protein
MLEASRFELASRPFPDQVVYGYGIDGKVSWILPFFIGWDLCVKLGESAFVRSC